MNVLIWHVHGSWMTNFVQGEHTYVVPVVPGRGPDGRGRARTWEWPASVVEVSPDDLADHPIDVAVVQRPEELELVATWCRRVPGRDIPLVWLEHNAPQGRVNDMRHPACDRTDVIVVHVTHHNALFWDTGAARARVVEHGVIDPGRRWTGERAVAAIAINEPVRRGRVVGADLFGRLAAAAPIDLFGMGARHMAMALGRPAWLGVHEDPPQHCLHEELAMRRCYVHPFRWTSLGLTLIEAMMLGMPVVALATTAVPIAVPQTCGIVSNDVDKLVEGIRTLVADSGLAASLGDAARTHAVERFALDRFLTEWTEVLEEARS
ncbi:MAG: glycosyltransferase [Acidimicrobiia bacterium]